jgi:serine-type D-Ala-D-Ala carboxypeptidase/endopeptidase
MGRPTTLGLAAALLACLAAARAEARPAAPTPETLAEIDRIFEEYRLDGHVPGMVYGVVMDGRLVHVRGTGVQDLDSKRPVTADTLFRIASMTKAFTAVSILKLRDDGRIALDAPAETYIPEIREWRYPTADAPRIRVRDLLSHTAGFVTDDPWGDRQTPMPEEEFSRLLRAGVPFTRPPATAYEYSNLGYAMLGRIVANASQAPYRTYVERTLLGPLGMTSSGYEVAESPQERRALGYRWEDDAWRREPDMAHGAFGAMGGLQTSASDYAKWVAFLLSAWPPRDDPDAGPVKRASVRELAEGANFLRVRQRFGRSGADACRQAAAYGKGMIVAVDCDLGLTLSHGGGYPGYGSHVLLMPESGVGIFALANRTYAGPSGPVWDAAVALKKAGLLAAPAAPVSDALASTYAAAGRMYTSGATSAAGDVFAMNFFMDRTAEAWGRELAKLKAQAGGCQTGAPITATGALSGEFTWPCEKGRVKGTLLLAPTRPPRIQALRLERAN